jgi:hypothetical protein
LEKNQQTVYGPKVSTRESLPPRDHKILIPKSKPGTANGKRITFDVGYMGKNGVDIYGNNLLKRIGADNLGINCYNDKIVGKDNPCSTRNSNSNGKSPGVGGCSNTNSRRISGSFKCPRTELTSAGGVVSNEQPYQGCTVDIDTEFDDGIKQNTHGKKTKIYYEAKMCLRNHNPSVKPTFPNENVNTINAQNPDNYAELKTHILYGMPTNSPKEDSDEQSLSNHKSPDENPKINAYQGNQGQNDVYQVHSNNDFNTNRQGFYHNNNKFGKVLPLGVRESPITKNNISPINRRSIDGGQDTVSNKNIDITQVGSVKCKTPVMRTKGGV